jgi:hypothetical protein
VIEDDSENKIITTSWKIMPFKVYLNKEPCLHQREDNLKNAKYGGVF